MRQVSLTIDGKTIIAATHDDHYFHVADRILKLDDGRLVPFTDATAQSPSTTAPATEPPSADG